MLIAQQDKFFYLGTIIMFASAIWSLIIEEPRTVFLLELQIGLMFVVLAKLSSQKK